jgi:hypothetical protein
VLVYVFDVNMGKFSDSAASGIQQFDHGLISDGAGGLNQLRYIRRAEDFRYQPSAVPRTHESGRDRVHNPTHVQEIKKSPQSI